MHRATPLIEWSMLGIEAGASAARVRQVLPSRAVSAVRAVARNGGPTGLLRQLLAPYERLLVEALPSDRTRAPVAAFAADAGASPAQPGSALYGFWQRRTTAPASTTP